MEQLTDRQRVVLRAVVGAYVGEAAPVGSATIACLLPVKLSAASVRNTMHELSELGLIEKPHHSSGRVPTERGLRLFVDHLLGLAPLADYAKRALATSFDGVDAVAAVQLASRLLSDHSGQLGFVTRPRLESAVLRHVSLVRLSRERLLVVLVSRAGQAHQRVIEDPDGSDQAELDHMAALLSERVVGRTLREVRETLAREMRELRSQAGRLVDRALHLGLRALEARPEDGADLVIATRLALLDQPEFQQPERIRELFEAIETQVWLVEVLDRLLDAEVSVAFGEELEEPALRRCALVVAPYGSDVPPLGAIGVIGPRRMDFARVIPLVSYCSRLVTEKFGA